MSPNLKKIFTYTAAIMLLFMAAAQLTTLRSTDPVLNELDPLLHLRGRQVLLLAGIVELVVSGLFLLVRSDSFRFGLMGLLSSLLVVHRLYLRSQKAPNFSDCLGNFNDWLPIAPRSLSAVWWFFLGLLLVWGYGALIFGALGKRKSAEPLAGVKPGSNTLPSAGGRSPFLRLALGWGAGGILLVVVIAALHLQISSALPRDFRARLDEITSVGTFRDAAVGNRSGSRLLYAREVDNGVGFFVKEIQTRNQRQVGAMDDSISTPNNAFRLIGWSPDDRNVAIAVDSRDNQTIAICSGDDQRLRQAFMLRDDNKQANLHVLQEIKRAVWLNNDTLVLMDCVHSLYLADLKSSRLRELTGYTTVRNDPGARIGDFTLVATSDHSIAFADSGRIWELDVTSGKARQLLELPNMGIQWLDYDPGSHRFLFCRIDPNDKNPEKPHYLCRLDTNATPMFTQLSGSNILKGQWILDGAGIAYVTGGAIGTLVVDMKDPALSTNLFVDGFVWNYSVSPGRDRLYAQAKLGSEPMGLWEYDVAGRTLRNVVSGLEQSSMAHGKIASRVDGYTEKDKVPYSVIAPTELNPAKKYPVVLDQPSESQFTQDAQYLANSGVYYVTIKEDGLDKIMAVYNEILKIPNVDPKRIYITGSSFRTETLSQAVNYNAGLWRGVIFLSPAAFPNIPEDTSQYPSVFISIGTKDAQGGLDATKSFTSKACANLIRTKVIYHEGAPHIFNSTKLAKERFSGMIEFILAGS